MEYGKPEAVQKDRRKKIGSMQQNNCDPESTAPDPSLDDRRCPKCGEETEPIEVGAEGLAVQELQLCPNCYLVTWTDDAGPHVRQGIPVDPAIDPLSEADESRSMWLPGEPEEC
jgi:hypothetical protein